MHHPAFSGLIGVARADITPPAGIFARNWGAATHEIASGIHKPLTATALSLRSEAQPAHTLTLIALDLGWWRTAEDEWAVRGAVIDALGCAHSAVVVALSHTHAGPSICADDADKPGGHLIAPYLAHVREVCVRLAHEARANAQPGRIEWAYDRCGLAQNRDLQDPARERIVCGFNPGAPADDTLLIGRASTRDGAPIATLVNYACHPVTLAWQNTLISPDFIGAARELIEQTTAAPMLFLQGASGELAPREHYTGDVAAADRNGRVLGHAVLAALENMLPPGRDLAYDGVVESGAPLAIWRYEQSSGNAGTARLESHILEIDLPLKPGRPTLAQTQTELASATDRYLRERLARRLRVLRAIGDGDTATARVWIWRIGEAHIVAQANEAYSQFQTGLRAAFSGQPICVLNIANGGYAYLPPRAMYGLDQYQVWQTPFDSGCLERMTQATIDALTSM
jgi:hypothetical protein